ncbi:MAG: Transposase [uncultured Sulfurovum sp.]|uniref:Transposase n=1 Tax=uncultured Sulfurovum sp. TaxID=269237 RepID=A0A6S6SPJ1_9BACT|nr:MAG: Transposase [uncultured Sulfurovum sp.]
MSIEEVMRNILLELEELREENRLLKEEIKRLKENGNKDSTNSSKPPSTDNGFKEKEAKNDKSTSKKRGGQKGRTSNNLKKSDNPDVIEILESFTCSKCHHNLLDVKVKSISKKQVFDIPPVKMKVTEFQQHNKVCPCCRTENKPHFPEGLNTYVQYGRRISKHLLPI